MIRAELGLPQTDTVSLRLTSEQGEITDTTLRLQDDYPNDRPLFNKDSQVLPQDIGYLRLEDMDEEAVEEVQEWMPKFTTAKGLIIDVRDNGGGTRDALLEIFPYFMTPNDPPHIANIAKYRLNEDFDDDHLEARFMYRQTFYAPDSAEFAAIEAFQQAFEPQWQPPEDKFSEWHYLVISKSSDDPRYFYDKPVVILTDPGVFSATDIFVAAFKGWRNVTIMGQPTSGGSARSRRIELDNSGLEIRMASMASFQPSGLLYDGNGVQPDILVEPVATDYLRWHTDSVLDAAIEFILESR
ncbi:MAG: S41 family peptidase [Deinococcota bacterium]